MSFCTSCRRRRRAWECLGTRPIRRRNRGRAPERRRQFAAEMTSACATEVLPVERPEAAAEKMDIIISATSSREPVLHGAWIADGAHLNVIGSNFLGKAEVDVETIRRSGL